MISLYKYVQINNCTYAYTIQGEGEPLLLLHGFTGSSETWAPFIEKWTTHFQIITIDVPGHGKTCSDVGKTMEQFANDVGQFLQYLQLDDVHLLGYSMGGRVALSIAMYYPEIVRTLILASASPGIANEKERCEREEADRKLATSIQANGIEHFVSFWENIPLFATQKQLPKKVQQRIRQERLAQSENGLANSLRYMGTGVQPSWWHRLGDILIPVCLIVGELDEKFIHLNKQMANKLHDVTFHVVLQAGHAVHVEQVEKFDKIVRGFIQNKES